jgi:hypothetical protein
MLLRSGCSRLIRLSIGVSIFAEAHLMQNHECHHDQDHAGVDFKKERGQHWYSHLAKLDEMQHRFLLAAGPFDVGSTMANIVCEAGSKPKRQHDVHQYRHRDLIGPHLNPL